MQKTHGFTIVELLVVIVVIGILAAITIVSYSGITSKADIVALTSDLTNAKKQFALYYAEHGVYPTGLNANNCPTGTTLPSPDTNYCLKPSSDNRFALVDTTGATYGLTATKNTLAYKVTESTSSTVTTSDWITIGAQIWAKTNLNVGTMITGVTSQTNNSILEKYCYDNTESNCTTYGGLYQWNEAMQYVTTQGAQGICPAGSHIPSDNDWKILEMQLGMTQVQADATFYRGTDQGTQLKPGGTSGLNIPFAGNRDAANGSFYNQPYTALLWSSSESSTNAWGRYLLLSQATVKRDNTDVKGDGFSVRCLGN